MGCERYVVRLKEEERDQLDRQIRGGKRPTRKLPRARILLKADTSWGVEGPVKALDISAEDGRVTSSSERFLLLTVIRGYGPLR